MLLFLTFYNKESWNITQHNYFIKIIKILIFKSLEIIILVVIFITI